MEEKLLRQIRILKAGFFAILILNTAFIFFAFNKNAVKERFEQIDVERINIIGENDKPVMAITNKRLIPGVAVNGKTYPLSFSDGRGDYSGIIFYNEQGDEVGGLVFNGWPKDDSTYFAIEHLSFDQWKQNQVVAMQYLDNGYSRRAGLRVWDRSTEVTTDQLWDLHVARNAAPKNSRLYDSLNNEIRAYRERRENGVERMFVGSKNNVAQIQLRDTKGNIRIKIYVDENDQAKLEFLDESGAVKKSFGVE